MAAYGLYTHIASNKVRSMLLLAGLFLLLYVLVYAGALPGAAFLVGEQTAGRGRRTLAGVLPPSPAA